MGDKYICAVFKEALAITTSQVTLSFYYLKNTACMQKIIIVKAKGFDDPILSD